MLSKYLEDLIKDEDGLKMITNICEDLCDYLDNPATASQDAIELLTTEELLDNPAKEGYLLWLCFRELTNPEKAKKYGENIKWFEDWLTKARAFKGKPTKDMFMLLAQKQDVLYGQKQKAIFDRLIDAAQNLYKHAENSALKGRFSKIVESCKAVDENYKNQKI